MFLIAHLVLSLQLLCWGNLLDRDTAGRNVSSVRVGTIFVSVTAVTNHQSNTHGSLANSLTVSPKVAMLVNVGICFAVVGVDHMDRVDGDWFGTFHTIEGKVPTLAATQAFGDPEIAIKLDLQR